MKILNVVHSFVPHTMAGTEIYSYKLSEELAKRHEVYVFFRVNDPKKKEYALTYQRYEGLETYNINRTFRSCSSFSNTYRDCAIDTTFSELMNKIKPDIVHIHHLLFLSCGIVDEIKKRGIPIVYTLHDYWLICYRGQLIKDDLSICEGNSITACGDCLKYLLSIRKHSLYLYSMLKRRIPPCVLELLKRIHLFIARPEPSLELKEWINSLEELRYKVDLFIAPSRFIKNKFIEKGIPEDKIIYLSYGFDYKNFPFTPKASSDVLRFGYMGTLLPTKGVDLLISAFKKIRSKDTRLSIYGKIVPFSGFEYYPKFLKKMINNDNRIKLMGAYDNKDVSKIFADIDVLVVPPIWYENAPLVIQEAFLSRTPVIASRIGGIPELVNNGINGILFNPNDADDLKEKMQYIIDNPDIINKFNGNIPKIKSIEENAEELEEIYAKLLKNG